MTIPRELKDLCDALVDAGGTIEERARSLHAHGPDGSWLMAFSQAPRNPQGTRQQLTSKLRRIGVL